MDVLEKTQTEIVEVARDLFANKPPVDNFHGVECILVKKLTSELLNSKEFPLSNLSSFSINGMFAGMPSKAFIENQKCIDEGIVLGIKIGKKLQIKK